MNAIMLDEYPGGISPIGGGDDNMFTFLYMGASFIIRQTHTHTHSHLHGHLNQQTIASHRTLNLDRLLTDAKLTDRLSSLRTL